MQELTIPVRAIQRGDVFLRPDTGQVVWEAVQDAALGGYVLVQVRFADGGIDWREWDDPNHRLTIRRPA